MITSLVEALTGDPPTTLELAESGFYDIVRNALRAARDDAGLSQSDVAKALALAQSEVSRLETSVGPGTRLGKLRAYLRACGAKFGLAVVTRANRRLEAGYDDARPVEPSQTGQQPDFNIFELIDDASSFRTSVRVHPGVASVLRSPSSAREWFATPTATQRVQPAADQGVLIDHVLAIDAAMSDIGLDRTTSDRLRRAFLGRLRQEVDTRSPAVAGG